MGLLFINRWQLQNYIRTYIQPLLRAVKQLDLQDILHHVTIKPKWVQQIGNQQLNYIVQQILED
ncbi:TPA: hypothetical protein EYN65_03725 [Candidatus Poribacteria bacterium]|nr:hypothetical protein [Candidatus Poribacteria bacterium]